MIKRAIITFLMLLIFGCNLFYIEETNSLSIAISNSNRTITPDFKVIDSYTIKFDSGSEIPLSGANHTLTDIVPGTYSITVYGYNSGDLIAKKNVSSFRVNSGSNNLPIELEYIRLDSGELSLNLNWENSSVNSINIYLTDLSVEPYNRVYISSDGVIDYSGRSLSLTKILDSGDYLLSIYFNNNSNTLLIYNEVVQIFKNLSSTGTQNFSSEDFNSPPEAPGSLQVLENSYGYKLEWVDLSNRETSYMVERSQYSGGSFGSWTTLDDTLYSNTESYMDSSADTSSKYKYRVTSVNNFGNGVSSEVETTDTTPPSTGTISVDSRTSTTVDLVWTKGIDNLSPQSRLKYSLYYSKDYTTPEDIIKHGSNPISNSLDITSGQITGLIPNNSYNFVLTIEDELGNRGEYPLLEVVMSSDTTPPPSAHLRNASWFPANAARVLWNKVTDSDPITYKLYYSSKYSNPSDIEAYGELHNSYFDITSQQDIYIYNLDIIKYYLVVVTIDSAGNKAYSNVVNQTVTGSPIDNSAPIKGTLSISNIDDFDITLTWSQADDEISDPFTSRENLIYQIYYSDRYTLPEEIVENGKQYNKIIPGTAISSNLTHKVDKLIYGTRYYFTIKVSDEMGNYTLYDVVNAQTTVPDILPDIRIKEVTPGEKAIHVDLDQEVTIYFYDELSPESVDNISVYANRVDINSSWETTNVYERVNGTISYDSKERAIVFVPNREIPFKNVDGDVIRNTAFKEGEVYQITIENVSSLGGETISWDFRFKTLDYSVFTSHWKFDNNGKDSSGKNRDLNQINASFNSENYKEGSHSIYLNGAQNAVINDLMLGDAFTVTAWVNMDYPMQESLNTIIANTVSNESSNGFKLCVNKWFNTDIPEGDLYNGFPNLRADKRIVIEVGNGTYGGKFLTDPDFVIPGGWFHLAFVIDQPNKTMKIFFDGVEANLHYTSEDKDTITGTKEIFDANAWDFKTDGKFYFGSFFNSTDYGFKGKIDDMRAYSTVLSDEDIKQIATQNY